MVLVLRVPIVDCTLQREVLYAALRNLSLMLSADNIRPAELFGNGCGDRSVKKDGVTPNINDSPVPSKLYVCWLPSRIVQPSSEVLHA